MCQLNLMQIYILLVIIRLEQLKNLNSVMYVMTLNVNNKFLIG